nr:hypothetical protein [Tanacetum cinerariifolium]
MTKSKNEVYDDSCCSKSCRKNTEDLNTKITKLNKALGDSKTNLYHYKLGLSQVEARLVEFKTQEIKFCEKIRGLEFDVKNKNTKIENLMHELEQVKKEKGCLDSKLTGFESASKDLDTLLGSQISDKNKEGLGYSVVPPFSQVYSPPKKDMSWTGLPEFADDTITDYSRHSPSIESNTSDLQNSNSSVSELEESSNSVISKPMIKFVKATDSPTDIKTNKVEIVRKSPVRYAEMYKNTSKSPKVRVSTARRVNTAAPRPNVNSARPKTTQYLVIIKLIQRVKRLERELKARNPPTKIQNVDVRDRSRSVMAWVPKKVNMDNPNITMEEYIKLEEEKTHKRAIVFNDTLTSEAALSCEPMISFLNDDETDLRISFDESDDDDYTTSLNIFSIIINIFIFTFFLFINAP